MVERKTSVLQMARHLRHYGDTQVRLKVGDEDMQIRFHVRDVTQPVLSVNSVNESGAGSSHFLEHEAHPRSRGVRLPGRNIKDCGRIMEYCPEEIVGR